MPKSAKSSKAKSSKSTAAKPSKTKGAATRSATRAAPPSPADDLLRLATELRAAATELDAKATTAAEADKPEMWARADDLRWKAQEIYTQAAAIAVSEAAAFAPEVLAQTAAAREVIKKINQAKAIIEIAGDLFQIAASIAAKKVGPLKAALKELKNDVAQYRKA